VNSEVFEKGSELNNTGYAVNKTDVMPIAYADLVVTSLATSGTPMSGRPLRVSWTVENQGSARPMPASGRTRYTSPPTRRARRPFIISAPSRTSARSLPA